MVENLLEQLNPAVITKKVDVCHDSIHLNFKLDKSVVNDFDEFNEILTDYMIHQLANSCGNPPNDKEHLLSLAKRLLNQSIRYENAAVIATIGADGGMRQVLAILNEALKKEARNTYIDVIISKLAYHTENFELDMDMLFSFIKKLYAKLKVHVPPSLELLPPEILLADYRKALTDYLDAISKHKKYWKL